MKRRVLGAAALLALTACGPGTPKADEPAGEPAGARTVADTLTRRQKDSILSTLPIPGAGKIGDAMKAVDRANARVQQHDTIR